MGWHDSIDIFDSNLLIFQHQGTHLDRLWILAGTKSSCTFFALHGLLTFEVAVPFEDACLTLLHFRKLDPAFRRSRYLAFGRTAAKYNKMSYKNTTFAFLYIQPIVDDVQLFECIIVFEMHPECQHTMKF